MKANHEQGSAASANIEVSENDQTITRDQSTGVVTIQQNSTVTVRNPSALYGYALSVRLIDSPPGATLSGVVATISSSSSTSCPPTSPCHLSSQSQELIKDYDLTATTMLGATGTFAVVISIPADIDVGDYILDLEYTERALTPILDNTRMQEATTAKCSDTKPGNMLNLIDDRDSKVYRVKRMVDGKCWMVDNLAFDLASSRAPTYSPAAQLVSGTTTAVDTRAQYAQQVDVTNGYIPNNGFPIPSYVYNWCAALGDTSGSCSASKNAADLQTVVNGVVVSGDVTSQPEVTGICPKPFRLPKGGPESSPASTPLSTANEFVKLDIAMGGTGIDITNTYDRFMGITTADTDWLAMLSGGYRSPEGLYAQGNYGFWWSSTAYSSTIAYFLRIDGISSIVNPARYHATRDYGFPIRCLL